ncbi:MAG: hypothetical protein AAFR16_07650 [Pseudomonadota bacterium]
MRGPDGAPAVEIFEDQDSSRLRLLADADLLAVRPIGDGARAAGELVACLDLL